MSIVLPVLVPLELAEQTHGDNEPSKAKRGYKVVIDSVIQRVDYSKKERERK